LIGALRRTMTAKADECRARAELCQRMVAQVSRPAADQATWLQFAQSWMILVQGEEHLEAVWSNLSASNWPAPNDRDSQARH
jgi:hypothetical protein